MSKLYFTYSAMNAGKSAILLQAAYNYREQGMEVMMWTSGHHGASPDAEIGKIESRIGLEAEAKLYRVQTDLYGAIKARQAAGKLNAVFVDEAQFLTKEQVWQLARVSDKLCLPVLCYGLRTDFQGELFEGSATLLAIADHLRESRTICFCGRKATMTARMDSQGRVLSAGEQVNVEKAEYVSFCRKHWEEALGRGAEGPLKF
ncbi:MAG: thymidine kinase [Pseudomonadota bacterium]